MTLTAILAISDDGIIGIEGRDGPTLPWRMPPDLARFKHLTSGHAVIMGRKTYESIGRPLPNRRNIVVTRTIGGVGIPGCFIAHNLDAALSLALEADPRPYVIGGAEIYEALWPEVSRVELTEVHTIVGLGRGFAFDRSRWRETFREAGEHDGLRFDFVTLERP